VRFTVLLPGKTKTQVQGNHAARHFHPRIARRKKEIGQLSEPATGKASFY